jgi:hypothetical protein
MRVVLLSLATFVVLHVPQNVTLAPTARCQFSIVHRAPSAQVSGAEDLIGRVRLVAQPDSPVAITALDFSETNLVVGTGAYEHTGSHSVEVLNISDHVVSDVHIMIGVRHPRGGTGGGILFPERIAPGDRAHRRVRQGRAHGTGDYAAEDVVLEAFVQKVTVGGCRYQPSVSRSDMP